ncbi:hypothetical protein BGZ54_009301 [Gamsiella multidivaricata]|nr:hypothetical protein BGZ54_009301 [Gamsiella multidivaricata]
MSPTALGSGGAQMQIAIEGWLWRRGNLLTWKRCYAIGRHRGDANPGVLTLFKDNEHLFPIKTIDMAECYEVQVKGQDAKATGRFEFKLVTRKEETWFATDTMSDRTGWIDTLNSLMAKAVGASLMKLEAKLNTIQHRNNSFDYAHTASGTAPTEKTATLEEHLQLVQQDLVTREQQLSHREQELERKRAESLLVQLEAWRAAAKVTVNQHYAVRDQLLERVMKTARTVQELIERARVHLETGSEQIVEVVNSHLECLRVHASESTMNATSYKMLKSTLVGLTVNLDTRSSEIKRVLLALDQFISATSSATRPSTSTSSPTSPTLAPANFRERRMSVGGAILHAPPPPAPSSPMGISVYLLQVQDKYKETLETLQDHSMRLKRVLERADINNPESARRFQEEIRETLKGLLKLPSYVFAPCLPDQPLPGAADTFFREDLVQIQRKSKEMLRKGAPLNDMVPLQQTPSAQIDAAESKPGEMSPVPQKNTTDTSSPKATPVTSTTPEPPSKAPTGSVSNTPPSISLALPSSLSSFLMPNTATNAVSTTDLTQRLRDTILPEFDHLSIKQEESLQSMTSLLNNISSLLVSKLTEIKDATAGQRQEFEELKDEIIDVMQLSATDPSAHQRDISALSEIRSKLAEITEQLAKVQSGNGMPNQQGFYGAGGSGSYRRLGAPGNSSNSHNNSGNGSSATATGFSLLQRSASTMVHSSFSRTHPFYHTVDSGSRQHLQRANSTSLHNRLQIPASGSLVAGASDGDLGSLSNTSGSIANGGKHPKIAGMARLFEDGDGDSANEGGNRLPATNAYQQDPGYNMDSRQRSQQNQEMASKLDQLLLLLEFVNTAQCRMMAYQDLEFDRSRSSGASNVDDGRMMAVQEHMEQMDKKMALQMHLLRRLVALQGSSRLNRDDDEEVIDGAQLQEIGDEKGLVDTAIRDMDATTLRHSGPENLEAIVTTIPSTNELSLVEVLNRLDLQVIPSVKDQSAHIEELSEQLSEMKRQLDEQQRRLDQQGAAPPRPRIANLGRSNSGERPTPPRSHSRSPSLTFIQQQPTAAVLSSPLEIDSPASWRASLRPSNSTGSNSATVRDRISSSPPGHPLSSSLSLTSIPSSLSNGGVNANPLDTQHGAMVARTSDRIAEMLYHMDTKLGHMVDEQLSRYEKGNKELLIKVHELLDGDHGDKSKDTEQLHEKQDTVSHMSPKMTSSTGQQDWTESIDKLKTLIQQEADRSESSSNEQRDEILEKMNQVISSIQESQAEIGSKDMAVKEELQELREWIVRHSSMQTENLREIVFAATSASGATSATGGSLTKDVPSRSILTSDADSVVIGGSASGSEEEYTQVDILDDLDQDPLLHNRRNQLQLPSSSTAREGTREATITAEEIQELIKDQLEMFTKIQMATVSELADNVSGVEKMMRDMSRMMGIRRGGTLLRKKENEQGRAMLKETIEEVMTRMSSSPSMASVSSAGGAAVEQKGATHRTSTDSETENNSSSGSRNASANNSARGESGIFKYLYQPRRPPSIATTTVVPTSPSSSATVTLSTSPSLNTAAAASMSIDTVVAQAESSSLRPPLSPASPTAEYLEDDGHAPMQMHDQLHLYHDQMEQLYQRKARVKIEVEDLQSEKQKLCQERDELKEQVEQLRKEKQDLLLTRGEGRSEGAEATASDMQQTSPTTVLLEKVLSERVSMLLQETARLEKLKNQLENETEHTTAAIRPSNV